MHGSRESSVWRTLAVAFGDGVAFGVGLTLTNKAARTATSSAPLPHPDLRQLADRIIEIERRIDRGRLAGSPPTPVANRPTPAEVADAVLAGIDNRFGEITAQLEYRLAELEARIKGDLAAFDVRDRSHAHDLETALQSHIEAFRGDFAGALEVQRLVEDEIRVLRGGMAESHKEFAESLAHVVDEQIEHAIGLHLQASQEQMRETVRDECLSAYAGFGSGVESLIENRFQAVREDMERKDRRIADLRARLDDQEHARHLEREALRGEFTGNIGALRSQITGLQKEFTESANRRLQAIEERRGEGFRNESFSSFANLGRSLESMIESRFQGMREEMESNAREMASLRARLEGQEHTAHVEREAVRGEFTGDISALRGLVDSNERQTNDLRSRHQELEAGIAALRGDLTGTITELRGQMDGTEGQIADLRSRHQGLEAGITALRGDLTGTIEAQRASVDQNITALRGQMDSNESHIADLRSRHQGLEAGITALRGDLTGTIEAQRNSVDQNITALRGQMDSNESHIADLRSRHQGLEAGITALRDDLTGTIEAQRNSVDQNITALRGQMDSNESHIADLRSRHEGLEAGITALRGDLTGTIEAQRNSVDQNITELRGQMDGTEGQIADLRSRNEGLEAGIESRMAALRDDLTGTIEAHRGSVDQNISALRGQVDGSESQLADLRSRHQELEAGIAALRGDLTGTIEAHRGSVDQNISALRGQLDGNESQIADLRSRHHELEAGIAALRGDLTGTIEAQNSRLDQNITALRGQVDGSESQLANLEAGIESRITALRGDVVGAIEAQGSRFDGVIGALRSQITESHREFAETLAQVTEEQVEHTVTLRLQAIQEQIREAVRDESLRTYAGFGNAAETLIETRVQGFREEMGAKDRQITELRTRLDGHEHNLLELVLGFGQRCMQAADRISVPGPSAPKTMSAGGGGGATSFPAETHIAPAADPELPSFARHAAPRILWRIPFVSCFLLAGGLLALHYLAA